MTSEDLNKTTFNVHFVWDYYNTTVTIEGDCDGPRDAIVEEASRLLASESGLDPATAKDVEVEACS